MQTDIIKIVDSVEMLKNLAIRVRDTVDPIALDTETNGLHFKDDCVVGFSFAFSENEGYYVPLNHIEVKDYPNFPKKMITQFFQILSKKKLIFHNAKFDIQMVSSNFEVNLPVYSDTMLMAYLLAYPKIGLKELISLFFNYETISFSSLLSERFGKQWSSKGFNSSHLEAEAIYVYAVKDVLYTYKLFNKFKEEIKDYSSLLKVETNLIPLVAAMNMEGILIDKDRMLEMQEIAQLESGEMLSKIREMTWDTFQVNSPKDVKKALYEDLGLPVLKRSKQTGSPSSDAEVLEQLSYHHELPKLLMEIRSLNKFISGYLAKIPSLLTEKNEMYANFSSIGADLT